MKKHALILFLILVLSGTIQVNACFCQWIQQNTGTTADLRGLSFLNENTGYVCGSGIILKTTNGGTSWNVILDGLIPKLFTKIQALNSNLVYSVGMFNTIIKSTNGGDNWIIIRNGPTGTGYSIFAMFFLNENTGWVGGQDVSGYVLKTTNGGNSFDSIPTSNLDGRIEDFYFINANTGLVCSDNGQIRKTTNGGYNWYSINIPIGSHIPMFNNFSFINNNTGFISSVAKKIYKTTDFGDNWDSLSYIPNPFPTIYSISFVSELKGWAVGSGYDVYYTTNGGISWLPQGGGGAIQIKMVNDSVGYKTGNVGSLYKTTNGGLTVYMNNLIIVPNTFEIKNVYPNPFNSDTKIIFSFAKNDNYQLALYNILGKKELELMSGFKLQGEYTFKLNLEKHNSGIYFLVLSNDNNFVTKKIILLK